VLKRVIVLLTLGTGLLAGSTIAQQPQPQTTLPTEPGLYVTTANGFTKILGQIVTFNRTGSLLANRLTIGIVAAKGNVQLLGPHAETVVGVKPEFYFIPAKQEAEAGGSAGDLVLIRLEIATPPGDRRQFEVGAQGAGRASSGISITHQIQLLRSEEHPGVYKLTPAAALRGGEYALYLARGEGMAAYVYDFSVPEDSRTVKIALSEKSTVPAADILKAVQKIKGNRPKTCLNEVWIAEDASKSDYKLEATKLDHSNGERFSLTLLNPNGDGIHETRGVSLDDVLENICQVIDRGEIPGGLPIQVTNEPAKSSDKAQGRDVIPVPPELSSANVSSSLATILVSSSPDGGDIYTDGAFVGNAPAVLKLSAGKHTIKVALAGYKDWSRDITALSGSEVHLTANLEKPDLSKQGSQTAAPVGTAEASAAGGEPISTRPGENTSTISVTSEPTGAQIYLDDSSAGIAPVTLKLKPGKHSIRAFKKDYQNWLGAVTVEAGQNLSLTVAMQKSE
jgi:PEGA domain